MNQSARFELKTSGDAAKSNLRKSDSGGRSELRNSGGSSAKSESLSSGAATNQALSRTNSGGFALEKDNKIVSTDNDMMDTTIEVSDGASQMSDAALLHQEDPAIRLEFVLTRPVLDFMIFKIDKYIGSFCNYAIIEEETGKTAFTVEGKWPRKFQLSHGGDPAIKVKKTSSLFAPGSPTTFEIKNPGQLRSTLATAVATTHNNLEVNITINSFNLVVSGDIDSNTLRCCNESTGDILARMGNGYFDSWATYMVGIFPCEDFPLVISCILILDWLQRKN